MLATALAPELLISKNCGDLLDIQGDNERLSELAKEDDVPWSRTHSLFANMGGFVIRGNVPSRVGSSDDPKAGQELDQTLQTQAASSVHGSQEPSREKNIDYLEAPSTTTSPAYANPYHLLASDIVALREAGFLKRLPYIPTTELNDKGKTDALVRFIAIIQILWIVIQIIVRAARHLAIAQLEIAVVAFSICAIVIYGMNWEKPKGVQVPYTLLQYRGDIPKPVLECVGEGMTSATPLVHIILEGIKELIRLPYKGQKKIIPGSRVQNHFTPSKSDPGGALMQIAGLFIGGTVFGAVHVAAWDFVFPTAVEQKLWWAASIISTCVPTTLSFFTFVGFAFEEYRASSVIDMIVVIWFIFNISLYVAARLFLLVEIFRTLLFLPPSAYVSTWAANVPHVA